MRTTVLIAVLFLAGCSSSHDGMRDTGHALEDASHSAIDGGIAEPPPGFEVCGTVICGTGEICCTATGACFDPTDATACTVPPGEAAPGACASNRDCAADELCSFGDESDDRAPAICTGGIGRCVVRRGPESCGGFGDGVCGCDGRTYADPCTASRAGVRVIYQEPCGTPIGSALFSCGADHPDCPEDGTCDFARGECVFPDQIIACGIDAQCRAGQSCCGITGVCVDSDCPDCCRVPPRGTVLPCDDDADCAPLSGGFPFTNMDYYCGGTESCGASGGCMRRMASCGGVLEPVCGCDGASYSNACWASAEAVNVAHEGMCM